ncbi:hypothetical protein [Jeotgalibacillus salarius]|uniref:DUF2953 domain-containing protein n=1 Tax=Jeotgalibacillus salarius TaxID=546023 RepID=A0A4Y8LDY5_9BACL|nr:hypothetical protein [Jeotgalibacillus salarius]TFE00917.1 hypothetical protein E2626_09600 [Jeotgalibacillus salarius]
MFIVIKVAGIKIKRWHIPIELSLEPDYKLNSNNKKFTKNDLHSVKENLQKIKEKVFDLKHWIKDSLKGFKVDSLHLSAGVGVDRPDWCAWLNGGIGILQSIIVQQISRFIKLDTRPYISIHPIYYSSPFTAACTCIISVSFAHLIKAGVILLFRRITVKQKKARKQVA